MSRFFVASIEEREYEDDWGRNWKGKMDGRERAVARFATALGARP